MIEEWEGENLDNSKRLSIIEDEINHILNLDSQNKVYDNDGNRQAENPVIENGTSQGTERKSEKRSSVGEKFAHESNHSILPEHPKSWPQRPLMIRPTPGSSTQVIGVRLAQQSKHQNFAGLAAGCILPINNGREAEGESLVVDFESTHFIGTLLLRIKQAPPMPLPREEGNRGYHSIDEINDNCRDRDLQQDYFANKKRKFQAVIRGRFKNPLSMSRCVTGQIFDRPAGKLPARWVVNGFIKFMSLLAPQLDVSLDHEKPRFLAPLVATAQTVLSEGDEFEDSCTSDDQTSTNLFPRSMDRDSHLHIDKRGILQEPASMESSSILSDLHVDSDLGIDVPDTTSFSATKRSLARKKIFNTISAKRTAEPRFNTSKTYTFEFYQHLLDFGDELAVDMGSIGGFLPLAQATNGQPLKVMAAHRKNEAGNELDSLWSFDIFHESLYSYAEKAFDRM